MPQLPRRNALLGAGVLAGAAGLPLFTAGPGKADPAPTELDLSLLRRAFALVEQARADGSAPYGALVADSGGTVIVERANTSALPGSDPTQHAELVAAREPWRELDYDGMNGATLYASTEPCSMCAGAAYWCGIGRVVYGLSNTRLFAFAGDDPRHASYALPCRDILSNGSRPVTVVGPLLEDEAARAHEGYWN